MVRMVNKEVGYSTFRMVTGYIRQGILAVCLVPDLFVLS
jgi:hypothetical protein